MKFNLIFEHIKKFYLVFFGLLEKMASSLRTSGRGGW